MVYIPGQGWIPDSEGDYMADGSDHQGWDKDYAHCASCDKLIDLDRDKWTVKDDRTLCEGCSDE